MRPSPITVIELRGGADISFEDETVEDGNLRILVPGGEDAIFRDGVRGTLQDDETNLTVRVNRLSNGNVHVAVVDERQEPCVSLKEHGGIESPATDGFSATLAPERPHLVVRYEPPCARELEFVWRSEAPRET